MVLVSARDALLARLVLSGKASESDVARFLHVCFGTLGTATAVTCMNQQPSLEGRSAVNASRNTSHHSSSLAVGSMSAAAVLSDAAEALLERSGIRELEERVGIILPAGLDYVPIAHFMNLLLK